MFFQKSNLEIGIPKKLRYGFVFERAKITMTLISSCHRNLLERPENAKVNRQLLENHAEKQFMSLKITAYWLFHDA